MLAAGTANHLGPYVGDESAVEVVRAILSLPEERLDYARAKLAFDRIAAPSANIAKAASELDRLTRIAQQMAGNNSKPDWTFGALRTLLYEPGTWNEQRPFLYDHSDPEGQGPLVRLLPNYLATRLGNCVSMPILFLILADRLGLDVALAIGPLHMLVRYRDESGRVHNIETTSGGHPAREEWLREIFCISDRALEAGTYLRSLPRREAVAHMAGTVVEHLFDRGRFDVAVQVCETILRHAPRDVYTMVKLGTACGHLLQIGFRGSYPRPGKAPPWARVRALSLAHRNQAMFAAAEALGWTDDTAEAVGTMRRGGQRNC